MPLSFSLVVTPSKNSNLNSQISLKQTLSTSLSQAHSFTAASRLILNVTATEAQRHRPTNRPKLLISLRPTPPSTSDLCHQSPQTHFSSADPLQVKTVGALLPSPPLRQWVMVVLRPRGSKLHSVDRSACSWLCLLVDRSGYRCGCACSWKLGT